MKRGISWTGHRASLLLLAAAWSGCKHPELEPPITKAQVDPDIDPTWGTPMNIAQGWSLATQTRWRTTSQGSQLMPWAWLSGLEQPDSEALFFNAETIRRHRYVPLKQGPGEPYVLPLGFVKDGPADQEPWVGYACAACHTSELRHKGTVVYVNGGQTMADMMGFLVALRDAYRATLDDAEKFRRFVTNSYSLGYDVAQARIALQREFDRLNWRIQLNGLDPHDPQFNTAPAYGYGRLDAFGQIYNETLKIAVEGSLAGQGGLVPNYQLYRDAGVQDANAPASYPHLWTTPFLDTNQWIGNSKNNTPLGLGPLGRNGAEVMGVFGHTDATFQTSANFRALGDLQEWLTWLQAPKWPRKVFGAPDAAQVSRGKALYDEHCVCCHQTIAWTGTYAKMPAPVADPLPAGCDQKLKGWQVAGADAIAAWNTTGAKEPHVGIPTSLVRASALGTDPVEVNNALTREGATGPWVDQETMVIAGGKLGAREPMITVLQHLFVEMVFKQLGAGLDGALKGEAPVPVPPKFTTSEEKFVYRGRPLDGIWATAPYFHNGSVPNLWETVLPPSRRSVTWRLGDTTFDPKNVGYITTETPYNDQTFDTRLPGNSNAGHDYLPAEMSDEDRWAIVEYMKTL